MATITLDLGTAAQTTRVIDAVCAMNGYQATLPDGTPNPETKPAFAKRTLIAYLTATVQGYERSQVATPAAPAIT